MMGQLDGALAVLAAVLVSVLATATAAVVAVTVLCVRHCRRTGTAGARLGAFAWGVVLAGALGYAWSRMSDMTLDPAQGDFWWSAWMTIVPVGNAVAAWVGAAIGGAGSAGSRR